MGFRPFGVDSSEQQLATARKLLLQQSVEASLTLGDLSALGEGGIPPADLVLSVGAAHFFGSIETFVGLCSSLLKPGGDLVISVPHPVDMVTQVAERDGAREVVLESYFPMDGQVRNAHYWRRFAGRVSLAEGLIEYLWRPGHLVNTLVSSGFELRGMWEPEYTSRGTVPCAFRDPDPWFVAEFYKRVPQYLITKATKKRIEES
jgi:SAM-dependent methyltransferase